MKSGIISLFILASAALSLQNCRSLNNQNQASAQNCKALIVDADLFQRSFRKPQLSYIIDTAYIDGQTLKVDIGYNGGCGDHDFNFIWDGSRLQNNLPVFRLVLRHENAGEACERQIKRSLCFSMQDFAGEQGHLQIQGWRSDIDLASLQKP